MKEIIGMILLGLGAVGILVIHEFIVIGASVVLCEGVKKPHFDPVLASVLFIAHCPLLLLIGMILLS